jgi:hypothetical protein
VASTTGSHSPPLSSRPASVTSNQYCIPPRRTALARHRGPTSPLACRKHHPPNLSSFLAAACLPRARPLRGGQAGCRVASCACRRSRPLSPGGRRGQWAAAPGRLAVERVAAPGRLQVNHLAKGPPRHRAITNSPSNRRPHRVVLGFCHFTLRGLETVESTSFSFLDASDGTLHCRLTSN